MLIFCWSGMHGYSLSWLESLNTILVCLFLLMCWALVLIVLNLLRILKYEALFIWGGRHSVLDLDYVSHQGPLICPLGRSIYSGDLSEMMQPSWTCVAGDSPKPNRATSSWGTPHPTHRGSFSSNQCWINNLLGLIWPPMVWTVSNIGRSIPILHEEVSIVRLIKRAFEV
jgi:hypothetical protein